MTSSPVLMSVSVLVPLALMVAIWLAGRRKPNPAGIAGRFLLGALMIIPCGMAGSLLDPTLEALTGHYYMDSLVVELVATAMPEELGKGLAALFFLLASASAKSPLAWLVCGAAGHLGFAAGEGLLAALGNEGALKILIGRSLGSLSHGCWGLVMGWFAWRGATTKSKRRWLHFLAALFVPAILHALLNASQVEEPGLDEMDEDATPTLGGALVVLSGIGALVVSLILAFRLFVLARRSEPTPPADGQSLD